VKEIVRLMVFGREIGAPRSRVGRQRKLGARQKIFFSKKRMSLGIVLCRRHRSTRTFSDIDGTKVVLLPMGEG
jgi:hypothetical protein